VIDEMGSYCDGTPDFRSLWELHGMTEKNARLTVAPHPSAIVPPSARQIPTRPQPEETRGTIPALQPPNVEIRGNLPQDWSAPHFLQLLCYSHRPAPPVDYAMSSRCGCSGAPLLSAVVSTTSAANEALQARTRALRADSGRLKTLFCELTATD